MAKCDHERAHMAANLVSDPPCVKGAASSLEVILHLSLGPEKDKVYVRARAFRRVWRAKRINYKDNVS